MKELQNPQMYQVTQMQPTFQAVIKLIVASLVEGPAALGLAVTPSVGSVTVVVGKVAILAEKSYSPNPKKKSIIVMEEKV